MRVGFTGHQDLGSERTVQWVSKVLAEAVKEYEVTEGFTCLAAGADQLYAEILSTQNIPYTAIIPSQHYEQTFTQQQDYERYFRLLRNAERTSTLQFKKPSERAFFEAGKRIVDISEILFAVWNGKEARGLGGTGDVVKYAIGKNKTVVHINPVTREVTVKQISAFAGGGTHDQ